MFCDVCAACFYVFFSNHLSILYLYNMSTTYIDQTVPPPPQITNVQKKVTLTLWGFQRLIYFYGQHEQ